MMVRYNFVHQTKVKCTEIWKKMMTGDMKSGIDLSKKKNNTRYKHGK